MAGERLRWLAVILLGIAWSGCASAPSAVPVVARGHPAAQLAADQRECDRNARTGHDPSWRARNVAWYVSTSPLWLLFPVFDPGNEKPGWVGAPPTAGRDDYLRAYRECMTARGYDAQWTGTAR